VAQAELRQPMAVAHPIQPRVLTCSDEIARRLQLARGRLNRREQAASVQAVPACAQPADRSSPDRPAAAGPNAARPPRSRCRAPLDGDKDRNRSGPPRSSNAPRASGAAAARPPPRCQQSDAGARGATAPSCLSVLAA
jgi:hypothetical protein